MQEQGPKPWTRETNWRQGHILPPQTAVHFGLQHVTDPGATCVVVITHDCDLANDNLDSEPDVEVIVGRTVVAMNGNFSWGKAPRTLHYTGLRNGVPVHIELVATSKRTIFKSDLAPFGPDPAFSLDGPTLAVLRSWLGSRYSRAAFPDAFVNRMKQTKADVKLAKVLEAHGKDISFVYFDLDEGQCIERADGDPYKISIVLVFNPRDDAEAAAEAAEDVAELVDEAVRARLPPDAPISLEACFAISEDDIPVSKARVLTQWRLEHMTLRADPEHLGPPAV